MSSTEQTKAVTELWFSDDVKQERVAHIRQMFEECGMNQRMNIVPDLHFETMGWDKYCIMMLALYKIKVKAD
jgi:ribosome-binding factor A